MAFISHGDPTDDTNNTDNHDGGIHLPPGVVPGSEGAKSWWATEVDGKLTNGITAEMKAQHGDKVVGVYDGKPLVPGEAGKGQGDFNYVKDKIMITQGVDADVARQIAAKSYQTKFAK